MTKTQNLELHSLYFPKTIFCNLTVSLCIGIGDSLEYTTSTKFNKASSDAQLRNIRNVLLTLMTSLQFVFTNYYHFTISRLKFFTTMMEFVKSSQPAAASKRKHSR